MDEERDRGRIAGFLEEERRMTRRLDGLAPAGRAALAASVAHRLLPHFRVFHERTGCGDPLVLHGALDGVWDLLEHGTAFDIVTVGTACLDQAFVAVDFGHRLTGTSVGETWRVANGAATPLVENAVHAAWAVASACHVAVHSGVLETRHCLRYGRDAALASALHRRSATTHPAPDAHTDPLVERETRRQLRDLELLEHSGPTTHVLTTLRQPVQPDRSQP
ncbi:DUF416 family protein [Streptomyces coffeae]|uniref:DUF416 family protein n=1 Tax=Streptomyces coffeae TaxID=621382 RepID=A0ABS1NM47_9ACTN|nr:DUF416 family protein [Streptomyces coffeae]MBL1101094.1 DUF416 family protein [Streptomyces coffeae]